MNRLRLWVDNVWIVLTSLTYNYPGATALVALALVFFVGMGLSLLLF